MRDTAIIVVALATAAVLAGIAAAQQNTATVRLVERFRNTTLFWQQFEVAKELANTGDPYALTALEPLLQDEDRHRRANAAFVFARLGDPRGLETIRTILEDRSDRPFGQGIPGRITAVGVDEHNRAFRPHGRPRRAPRARFLP